MKKNKSGIIFLVLVIVLLIATVCVCICCTRKMMSKNTTENMTFVSQESYAKVSVKDVAIENYVITYDAGSKQAAKRLQSLIYDVSGQKLKISMIKPTSNYIDLSYNKSGDDISIKNGIITISSNDSEGLIRQVNVFANTYLGYAFAGESREHILENTTYVIIPSDKATYDEVWIKEREPIICLWKTNAVRGVYQNPNVSLKSELMSYSDDQLYNYVKMMKYCGYTGIQVTDMCSTWAQYGGYEFVQQRIRFMADAAHSLDMNFTLWVWGAEFNGYGWVDNSVVYYSPENLPRDNPETIEVFDKYYSIYAKLADCSDRVIMHFNDPGNLSDSKDIGFYAHMFQEKCLAVNPDINFGVSCYTYQISLEELKEYMDEPFTVYSGTAKIDSDIEGVSRFREYAMNNGLELGVWSWNLTEMEIDQLAEMNVNSKVISDVYKKNKPLDNVYNTEYWSEMDSYHMANLFSMYCAGQMLQNPDLEEDIVLYDVCEDVVGKEYASDLFEVLNIIQDARSGDSFDEFKNGYENHILYADDYPAKELVNRCDEAMPKLQEMIDADLEENTVPLAISTSDLLSMIMPHLEEIKEYAEFRIMLDEAEEMYASGKDSDELQNYIEKNYKAVGEYNTVVGSWGCAEGLAQYNMIEKFCEKAKIDVPHDAVFDYYRKQRIYGEMITFQKKNSDCQKYEKGKAFQFGLAFSENDTIRLVEEMLGDGILSEDSSGKVYLTDWENYRYDF